MNRSKDSRSRWRAGLRTVGAAIVPALVVSSCSHLPYYGQAVWGGAVMLAKRRPIERVLEDPATPEALALQLRLALDAREFATRALGLPDNRSYRSYVELQRPFAVWNVVAAPALSVSPVTWCFPVAGCVSYRGYFSHRRAERFAARLRRRGFDVDLGGVAAFSTLGRFRDPVLSTFVHYPEPELAGLVFHELAHQRLYLPGDTPFNESFATTVELEGLDRWLRRRGDTVAMTTVGERYRRQEAVATLILGYRERLAETYAQPRAAAWKRQRKADLLTEMRQAYQRLRQAGGGTPGYDAWFDQELNNAHLASIGAYHRLVPGFRGLLAQAGGDLEAFYAAAERVAALPAAERERALAGTGR